MLTLNSPPKIGLHDAKINQREAAGILGVAYPTCCRYMTSGVKGVRLPSAKIGGKRVTTREAVAWFFEAVQIAEAQQRDGADAPAPDDESLDEAAADLEAAADAAGL